MVFAARMELGSAIRWPLASPHSAEESLEEITELAFSVLRRRPGELETCVPVGRWSELLTRLPLPAQLVVGRPLLGVGKHLVGLTDLLESGLGTRIFVDVGMVGSGKFAVGLLDLVLGRAPLQPQDFVVILEFHKASRGSWSA